MAVPTIPIFFERLHPGFGDQLAAIARKHEAIEACLQPPGNIENLAQQHSNTDSSDPCNIGPFILAAATRGAEEIRQLQTNAISAKEEDDVTAGDASDDLGDLASEREGLQLQEFAGTLEQVKETARNNVQTDSALLEEVVSYQKAKGRDQVLRSVYGSQTVENAHAEAKAEMFKEVRSNRIAKRVQTTIDAARSLCDDNEWNAKLAEARRIQQQILDLGGQAEALHQRADRAAEVKDEISTIVEDLDHLEQAGEKKLAQCRNQKRNVQFELNELLSARRAALKQILATDAQYTDKHIDNEALRLQIATLEQSLVHIASLKAEAQAASQPAFEACDQWQESALDSERRLREGIEVENVACKSRMMVPTQVAAFNMQLGMKLLTNVARDNEAEMSSIQTEKEEKRTMQCKLEIQMDSEEPEQDIDVVENEHAKLIDEQASLEACMTTCQSTNEQLQRNVQLSHNTWNALNEHFMGENVEQMVRTEAHDLADDLFKEYKLFRKGKPHVSSEPSSLKAIAASSWDAASGSASSTQALATIRPGTENWEARVQQMIEEEAQRKFERLRAELFSSMPPSTAPPSSAPPSEAGVVSK